MKQIVFLGGKSLGARCLEYCLVNLPKLGGEVIAIGTSPRGEELRQLADEHNILLIDEPNDIPKCDIILSVQYHKILKETHLKRASQIAVNLHMAPLPEYRGCNQFTLAILNGDVEFGVTLHAMDEGIDSGPIIAERRFPITNNIWVADLLEQSIKESFSLFAESLSPLLSEDYEIIDQIELESIRGTKTTFRKEIERMKVIDLSWDAERIKSVLRATSMKGFSPPFTYVDGKKVKLEVDL